MVLDKCHFGIFFAKRNNFVKKGNNLFAKRNGPNEKRNTLFMGPKRTDPYGPDQERNDLKWQKEVDSQEVWEDSEE